MILYHHVKSGWCISVHFIDFQFGVSVYPWDPHDHHPQHPLMRHHTNGPPWPSDHPHCRQINDTIPPCKVRLKGVTQWCSNKENASLYGDINTCISDLIFSEQSLTTTSGIGVMRGWDRVSTSPFPLTPARHRHGRYVQKKLKFHL